MDAFVERTDRNASRSSKQRNADIVSTQSQSTGSRLVVFHAQYGHIRIPVGRNEAYFRCTFHDDAGTIRQPVKYRWIRAQELGFNGVFLIHQIISFQLHISIRILSREIHLNGIHVFFQGIGRSKIDNQFAIRQWRIGDASHKVVSTRSTSDRGSDMGDFLTGFQIGFNRLQVLHYLFRIGSFGKFILHVKLIVHHIREEALFHKKETDAGKNQ